MCAGPRSSWILQWNDLDLPHAFHLFWIVLHKYPILLFGKPFNRDLLYKYIFYYDCSNHYWVEKLCRSSQKQSSLNFMKRLAPQGVWHWIFSVKELAVKILAKDLPSKHINVELTLKQCWSSTYIDAVSALTFGWKWKLDLHLCCFKVDKTTLKQRG